MAEVLPVSAGRRMTHGIVNAPAAEVDADLLMPTMARYGATRRCADGLGKGRSKHLPRLDATARQMGSLNKGWEASWRLYTRRRRMVSMRFNVDDPRPKRPPNMQAFRSPLCSGLHRNGRRTRPGTDRGGRRIHARRRICGPVGTAPCAQTPKPCERCPSRERRASRCPRTVRPSPVSVMVPRARWDGEELAQKDREADAVPCRACAVRGVGTRRVAHVCPGHMRRVAEHAAPWSWIGWSATGVAITHVVSEAERLADLMRQKPAQ